jgi:rare lipoprotein A
VSFPALVLLLFVAGCATVSEPVDSPGAPPAQSPAPAPAPPPPSKGGYYKDDGPGANPPANLAAIPDAVPRAEPLHRFANRPYQAFGKDYLPMTAPAPFRQSGLGSWYGRRFHGGATSSGEKYDMYAMTAAHPTLPIPSYARVSNPANGRSVVVRINDRGPFHSDRIIDLSYAAAFKLGYVNAGSVRVEVEAIQAGDSQPVQVVQAPPAPPQPVKPPVAGGDIYVQLGAFSAREAAENFRARVYRELAWLQDAIYVVAGGALFRLQAGPYRTQDQARAIADRIQSELSLRPVIVGR